MNTSQLQPDFVFGRHGSVDTLHPVTDAAREWLQKHAEDQQFYGTALVIDWHYSTAIVAGIVEDGLHVANTRAGHH